MNKTQRIYLSSGDTGNENQDKYIKVRLEQNTETLEFMSLRLGTADVYQNFNADYGVLVGRVVANGGIGIPNAKISIFIPLTDEDADDKDIYSIYPYKTPRDKNNDGKRYNLLPRVGIQDPITGIVTPKQPFGSFPIKEETVGNLPILNVYKKYYKYTALTNSAGDYMIFGVPTGTQTVHLSVDITDIGKYSMNPASMVTNLGYSPNLFTDGGSKIKSSSDLNDLPNIETQEISVDVVPFWGDVENFEIGITRQDFRIRSVLNNTFVLFGSVFTDGSNSLYGNDFASGIEMRELYRLNDEENENVGIKSKRIGKVTEKIYYYPNTITDTQINAGTVDPKRDMLVLDPTEYSAYKREGDFIFILSCNRSKIVTDELGNEIPVAENSSAGVFTKFRGFMTLEITPEEVPMNFNSWLDDDNNKRGEVKPFRHILKFPQSADKGHSFRSGGDSSSLADTDTWRKQHYEFTGGSFYSVAHFHGVVYNNVSGEGDQSTSNGFLSGDHINEGTLDPFWNTGMIATNDYGVNTGNTVFQMVNNTTRSSLDLFGGNWLNLGIHLIQNGDLISHYSRVHDLRTNSNFTQNYKSRFYLNDNVQEIAGGHFNTKWFARSDLHYTDFIKIPQVDINAMADPNLAKGFTQANVILTGTEYRNGSTPCPVNGGKVDAIPTNQIDPNTYFYKGFDTADCIAYLKLLGIV